MSANGRARVEDVGEKIGGARKDRFAEGLTLADLDALTPAEAHLYATKDNAWPAPDYAALIEAGMPPIVAATVKVIRDRVAAAPAPSRDPERESVKRRDYVRVLGAARTFYEAAVDERRARAGTYGLLAAMGYGPSDVQRQEVRDALVSTFKGRSSPFDVSNSDVVKARKMVDDGFPAKVEAALRGVEIVQYSDRHFPVRRGQILHAKGFDTREDAVDWLRARRAAELAAKKDKPKLPSRPHLDKVERSGLPDRRGGRDVEAADFMETFGFRGVEFGNWLPDDERRKVLNLGYDALLDLAEALDLPPEAISLDGRLGLAFGARGQGSGAAHYDPTYVAINLTRLNGAGTLAHEWFHALDHFAGEAGRQVASGAVRSGSGWYEWRKERVSALQNLDGQEAAAWEAAMLSLRARPRTREEAVESLRSQKASAIATAAKYRSQAAGFGEDPSARFNARKFLDAAAERERHAARIAKCEAAIDEGGGFGNAQTDYLRDAVALCGPSGDYWKRPTEMGARAFEAAVFDRLAANGASSPYLVQGVEGDRFEGADFKGNPYPSGPERESICAAIMGVVEAMAARLGRDSRPRLSGP